jgi:hypothetical protein
MKRTKRISKILACFGDKIILLEITPSKAMDNQLHFKFTKDYNKVKSFDLTKLEDLKFFI